MHTHLFSRDGGICAASSCMRVQEKYRIEVFLCQFFLSERGLRSVTKYISIPRDTSRNVSWHGLHQACGTI